MFRRYYCNHFKKQLKLQQKKYRSITEDVLLFLKNFDPKQTIPLGDSLYKARLFCRSLNRGKSGGFRIIILLLRQENLIVPVTLFFKGDFDDISEEEMKYYTDITYQELEDNDVISS